MASWFFAGLLDGWLVLDEFDVFAGFGIWMFVGGFWVAVGWGFIVFPGMLGVWNRLVSSGFGFGCFWDCCFGVVFVVWILSCVSCGS